MYRYTLTIVFLFYIFKPAFAAQAALQFLGTYDNVSSSASGHCYGTSVSLWQINNSEIIGMLDVHAGLCGDPPCSLLKGNINNNIVSVKTTAPVYNKHYLFTGYIINSQLTGMLNKSKTTLQKNSFNLQYKNVAAWCAAWSKVLRCKGVKAYCK